MVTIKYVNVSGLEILNSKNKMTNIGELYLIDDSISIDGYTLVKAPATNTILVDSDIVEVIYYYAKNTSIKVKYVDIDQNRELINTISNSSGTNNMKINSNSNIRWDIVNNNIKQDNNNQVIAVANTSQNESPTYISTGITLFAIGIIIILGKKKTRKVFYK